MNIALPVLGGLGLFLYGMTLMSAGLEKIAGGKLKKIIGVLTTNIFMGVLLGAVITLIIQSSSATTVMVIGFVNAGIMSLTQATGVIMGANVGTTITAQLIAFNLTDYAPLVVISGVILLISTSNKKTKDIAEILIGIGILFIGMGMMSDGLQPLEQSQVFASFMIRLNNPVLGMIAGFVLTILLQSSSASIGLVQALASQGLIGIDLALPIIFGENIGSTTTALLSSIGANKTAKRAAIIHFLFNLTGTIIFMIVLRYPIQLLVTRLSMGNVSRQIANAHSLFNIINVIIQLPFAKLLVDAARWIIPGGDEEDNLPTIYLDERIIETPSIALGQVNKEILRMGDLVVENFKLVKKSLLDKEYELTDKIFKNSKLINRIGLELKKYLIYLSSASLSDSQQKEVSTFLIVISDLEGIDTHINNLSGLAQYMIEDNLQFNHNSRNDLYEMFNECIKEFKMAREAFEFLNQSLAKEVLNIKIQIDELEKVSREVHINKLDKKDYKTKSIIIFWDSLTNLERISDHSANIARYIITNIY